MANLSGVERSRYVQDMFTRIAHRYDLMNRLMTFGQDIRWRQIVVRYAALPPNGKLLDLGAGTGDLAWDALHQQPDCRAYCADFTLEMMRVGKARRGNHQNSHSRLNWNAADAHMLPYPDNTFDAVVSGFLLRNVSNLAQSLGEQFRVLKPGGKFVSLDTSPPPNSLLAPLVRFHMHRIIPVLGVMVAGHADAYTYLPDSTEGFLEPERLAARLFSAGFTDIRFRRLMFGSVAIHWAEKPGGAQ